MEQNPEALTFETFDSGSIFRNMVAKLKAQSLPMPGKPREQGPEYSFPEDPSLLSTTELGQLMLRLTALNGYAMRLLGVVDSELVSVEAEYKLKSHGYSSEVRAEVGRVNADVVEALVLKAHENVLKLYKRRTELQVAKTQLDSNSRMYQMQWQALSRELARRDAESRMG